MWARPTGTLAHAPTALLRQSSTANGAAPDFAACVAARGAVGRIAAGIGACSAAFIAARVAAGFVAVLFAARPVGQGARCPACGAS